MLLIGVFYTNGQFYLQKFKNKFLKSQNGNFDTFANLTSNTKNDFH